MTLAITRQADEEIVISDCIILRIVDIHGDKIRIAIEAPDEVAVDRAEIFHDKNMDNPYRPIVYVEDLRGKFQLPAEGQKGKLSLTRRAGEEIKIGADVTVRVYDIKGDKVRIAIDAPDRVPANRYEVYEDKLKTGTLFPDPPAQ